MLDNNDQKNNQLNDKVGRENAWAPKEEPLAPETEDKGGPGPSQELEKKEEEVKDIFAETDKGEDDKVAKPAAFQPKESSLENAESEESGHQTRKIFILIIVIAVLVLLGAGSFWAYKTFIEDRMSQVIKEEEQTTGQPGDLEVEPTEDSQKTETPVAPESAVEQLPDSDQDGLSDEEERALGTNINNVDSDGDNLFDREEVKVYKTDPLNPDTDNDGYLDGEEVRTGFNPKGAGKLFEIE